MAQARNRASAFVQWAWRQLDRAGSGARRALAYFFGPRLSPAFAAVIWMCLWAVTGFAFNSGPFGVSRDIVGWARPFAAWVDHPIALDARIAFVEAVLVLGLPSTLLALVSVALTTLGPYVNPSTVLRHRRYRLWRTFVPIVSVILGRSNALWSALLVSLAVSGAAAGVAFCYALLGIPPLMLTMTLLLIGLTFEFFFVLRCMFLAFELRVLSRLIVYLRDASVNVVQRAALGRLVRLHPPLVVGDDQTYYVEQEELGNLIDALDQVALLTWRAGQLFASRLALQALREVHDGYYRAAAGQQLPMEWFAFGRLSPPTDLQIAPDQGSGAVAGARTASVDWVTLYVIHALGAHVRACAGARDLVTGREAANQLLQVAGNAVQLTLRGADVFAPAAVDHVLAQYRQAVLQAAQAQAFELEEELIDDIEAFIQFGAVDKRGQPRWMTQAGRLALPDRLHAFVIDTGTLALARADARLLLRLLDAAVMARDRRIRRSVWSAALLLFAIAIGSEQWDTARLLLAWLGRADHGGLYHTRVALKPAPRERHVRSGVTIEGLTVALVCSALESGETIPWRAVVGNAFWDRICAAGDPGSASIELVLGRLSADVPQRMWAFRKALNDRQTRAGPS